MNKLILYLVIITAASFVLNCTQKKSKIEAEQPISIKIDLTKDTIRISKSEFLKNKFELTEIVKKDNSNKVSSTGMLEVPPNGRAIISAQVGGYIKNSLLLIGDQVRKGDFLVSIENIEFLELQQQYLETLEQLTFLESDYKRQSELYKENISSEKSFLKAQSEYKRTFAIHIGLKKKLNLLNINTAAVEKGELSSMSNIYAPIAGDISEINVKTGSYVAPSDAIMEIVNTEHVHLELKIFEKDALKVRKGQKVVFRLPESSGESYIGSVHLIGKSIGADRTVTAHVHIDEEGDAMFIPGMFVQAEIIVDDSTSLVIQEEALLEIKGKVFILKMISEDADHLAFIKVEVDKGNYSEGKFGVFSDEGLDVDKKYLKGVNSLL